MRYEKALLPLFTALAVASVVPKTDSKASINKYVVHESRSTLPGPWIKMRKLRDDETLPVRIALKQKNLGKGEDLLAAISDPTSTRFGQHMRAYEVHDFFAASPETVASVSQWLHRSGIDSRRVVHTDNKGWLAFDATVRELEDLLLTEYHGYEHANTGQRTVACDAYHVPDDVQPHIDLITPGIVFKPLSDQKNVQRTPKRSNTPPSRQTSTFKPKPNDLSTCDKAMTPACIRALYRVPMNTLSHAGNALGIFEEGDFYAQQDLDTFFSTYARHVPNGTHPDPAFIDGASAPVPPQQADGESDLDFEIAFPLIYPQRAILFQTDDQAYTVSGAGGLFNTFLDAIDGSFCNYTAFREKGNDPALDDIYPDMTYPNGYKGTLQCGVYRPTNVISISYSKQEADLPYYYQQRQCNEFMKLALQGHTVLIASGDFGVSGRSYDPEPNGCLGPQHSIFNPGFPSCPYVTLVGATKIQTGRTIHDPEIAAYDPSHDGSSSAYSSGGGFSNIYSIPSYQKPAVDAYFADHQPRYKSYSALHNATHNSTTQIGANGGVYNRIGRGMPDISANGQNIVTYIDITYKDGGYGLSEGTSASTPLVASLINNINEKRLAAGKKPIGFLNYILYSNPNIFNDVVNGTNPGCGTEGFRAVPGWDPVTGLGTPDYSMLLKTLDGLP